MNGPNGSGSSPSQNAAAGTMMAMQHFQPVPYWVNGQQQVMMVAAMPNGLMYGYGQPQLMAPSNGNGKLHPASFANGHSSGGSNGGAVGHAA